MTDTDRIDFDSYDDPDALEDALNDWDEYSDEDGEYDDFIDWLNGRG